MKPFGAFLKKELEKRNMTRQELARVSGVDHAAIIRIYRGQHWPYYKTLIRIAKAFNMKTWQLIKRFEEKK